MGALPVLPILSGGPQICPAMARTCPSLIPLLFENHGPYTGSLLLFGRTCSQCERFCHLARCLPTQQPAAVANSVARKVLIYFCELSRTPEHLTWPFVTLSLHELPHRVGLGSLHVSTDSIQGLTHVLGRSRIRSVLT